jgi:uncharacterized membrane protein YhaH (DUF805 family)
MGSLFTTVEGRIGRKQYWIGSILLFVAAIVLVTIIGAAGGVGALSRADGGSSGAMTLVTILILAASAPLVVKRLKDRNKSPHYAWLLYGPAIISTIAEMAGFTGTPTEPNTLGYALSLVSLIIGLWFFIELGFLRGTAGPNGYGPDPVAVPE